MAHATVVGMVGAEIGLRVLVQVARVLHGDLHAPDARHAKLARADNHHLMVHVPKSTSKACRVDVLVVVVLIVLDPVNVELLLARAPVLKRLVPLPLLGRELPIVEWVGHSRDPLADNGCFAHLARVRDDLHFDLRVREREVHEAVLHRPRRFRLLGRSGATAAPGDNPSSRRQEIGVEVAPPVVDDVELVVDVVHLLVVLVTRDDQVDAMGSREVDPIPDPHPGRRARDHYLPVCVGFLQEAIQPVRLLLEELVEVCFASA
mmetsp:Transcript_8369/g.19619  ORF Transcript_8369/g.19619 Transcript_8369/m.19619 type:complete len:262 (-) Transcript_8369:1323-2108(-)